MAARVANASPLAGTGCCCVGIGIMLGMPLPSGLCGAIAVIGDGSEDIMAPRELSAIAGCA